MGATKLVEAEKSVPGLADLAAERTGPGSPFLAALLGADARGRDSHPRALSPPPQATDSDYEDELPKHSFVNHYMSDPTYYNSWKRQQKGTKPPAPYRYEECGAGEAEPYFQTVITTQSSGGGYTPPGQPAPGSRTPVTGFSSFV